VFAKKNIWSILGRIMKYPQQKRYKIITIVRPTLSSDKAMQLMQSLISVGPEEQIESQTMNMQVLAYPIDRNKQGHLVITELRAFSDTVHKIRRNLEIEENVLRVLCISNETKSSSSEKEDSITSSFQVKDEYIKSISSYTTKRGKIVFGRVMPPRDKRAIAQSIKRLRFLGLLPFCNYDV
jgi:ribosomal protein S6/ribosomal protein S18